MSGLPPAHFEHQIFWGKVPCPLATSDFSAMHSVDMQHSNSRCIEFYVQKRLKKCTHRRMSSALCALNICSILHPLHSAALSDLIDTGTYSPNLFCFIDSWIRLTTTLAELTAPDCLKDARSTVVHARPDARPQKTA